MRLRLRVQVLREQRRSLDQRSHRRLLAVQDAQRVAVEASAAVRIQFTLVGAKILLQPLTVAGTRRHGPERVDHQSHPRNPQRAPQPRAQRDQLDVDIRSRKSQGFEVKLIKLPVATLLRPLVPEHRTQAPELVARAAQQAVGDCRPGNAGGRLGAQRQAVAAEVLEGIHLLFDDIGVFADRALEQLRMLDDGHPHLFVAIGLEHRATNALEMLPGTDFGGQHVIHAAHRLDLLAQGGAVGADGARWGREAGTSLMRPPSSSRKRCGRPLSAAERNATGWPSSSSVMPSGLPSSTRSGPAPLTCRTDPAPPKSWYSVAPWAS